MKEQMPLDQILRVWATSPSAAVAARRWGISRRTLYDRIENASVTELQDAFRQVLAEAKEQFAAVRNEAAHALLAT